MEILKLFIPQQAKSFYLIEFKSDPWAEFKPVIGDDNFCTLEIEEPITEDIEKIADAAESYGFDQGWAAAVAHYGIKPDK